MKREVKIGLFAVAMIGAAWAGIRFLKGFDIFSRNAEYYAVYDQVGGVQTASPIMVKGVKIGTVSDIRFDPSRSDEVVLQFTVKRAYRIPTDSEAKIVSNSLMGSKAIEIVFGTAATYFEPGDTIRSGRDRDLMDMAGSELDFVKQKVSQVTADLSRTLNNLSELLEANEANIAGTLGNLNSLSGNMNDLLVSEKKNLKSAVDNLTLFSEMLGANAGRIDSIAGSLNRVATTLDEEEFARKLTASVAALDNLMQRVGEGEGTLGRLVEDPALYDSLTMATGNLSALLADVKAYPARYVHLSLFGRDPEKMKERADRRKAKAAAKAERDSLKEARQAE
ncbi:MAG: MlaD family protein [Alistipes sp.]|nr:MlaD family protein [Alistipes sp.]MDE5694755.1 MlaD family protein [Alistipes sp.]MDE7077619.1 MlaD family protein [Alistipes sp.]MDE7344786.1 MlaD family protein [Alistipes sp.]